MPALSPSATDSVAEPDTGVWPVQRHDILDWLMIETREERFVDVIFVKMCERLVAAGVPVARATMHFRTHNPQWLGARVSWKPGMQTAELRTFEYGIEETSQYLRSPVSAIHAGADEIRRDLTGEQDQSTHHSFYDELRESGLTDYITWPLLHTLGKRHVVSYATARPGGFTDEHIAYLRDLLPALALVSEIRLKNRLARTLLETYVGPHASDQILDGATTRGSGITVGAAILICDLRDFTAISDVWPRDDVIDILNGYFDAMSEPIEKHGGEILKFMGDGLLAIFPLSNPNACVDLLRAITEAQTAMDLLNIQHIGSGREPLRYGVGVHVGDVMYGNIGSRKRLDFTVIGPAVNIASRLESLTKEIHHPVLMSRAFAEMAGGEADLENLGFYPLRGVGEPVEVFAL